jgi:hypothetical protein
MTRILFVLIAVLAATTWLSLGASTRTASAQEDPDDVVRNVIDAVNAADVAGAEALVAEDFVLTELGFDSFAVYGRQAFGALVATAAESNVDIELSNLDVEGYTVTGEFRFSDDTTDAAGVSRTLEDFTAVVNDDGLLASFDLVYRLSDSQTVEYLEFVEAQEEEEPEDGEEPPEFTVVALAAQPGGNQPGDAFVFPFDEGVTGVGIEVTPGATDVLQPAHFHTGTCASPGPIVEPLASVYNGSSFTILSAPYDDLVDQGLIINVHKSQAEPGSYVSCGLVASAAAAPTPTAPAAATPTPSTGIGAPDTGTGPGASDGSTTALYALLAGGAFLVLAGSARALRRRAPVA